MTNLEKKARELVRENYFEYKTILRLGGNYQNAFDNYYYRMQMLCELFPNTNEEKLEIKWDSMWKKENY